MRLLLIVTTQTENIDEVLMIVDDNFQQQDVISEAAAVLGSGLTDTVIAANIEIPDDMIPDKGLFSEYRPYIG